MMVLIALILLAVSALAGLAATGTTSRKLWFARVSWMICLAAVAVLFVAGCRGLGGHNGTLDLAGVGGLGPASLRVDELTGLFLVISCGVAVPVLLSSVASKVGMRPRLGAAVALVMATVAVVLTADNLFVLLAGWEALGFAFYLLAGYDRAAPEGAQASVLASVFSKVSGAALLLGGLLLASHSHSFLLSSFTGVASADTAGIAYALLLFGFGVKVGLVPVQVWLPPVYANAPGPARAVMAGVAVNVGFYGMWRTFQVLGAPPVWLACVVLVLAGTTAILGISHAAVHADLRYLIAWSSVENAGLITAGFGAALVGAAADNAQLAAVGMLAATAQVCAHAMGKSLLFMCASVMEQAAGTTELDQLRGLARRLPFSGTGLTIGALTLAGVPLTAGFASEWFTLEALMQQFRVGNLALQMCTAIAGVLIALTIGVAGVAFVRLIGLTVFGTPSPTVAGPEAAEGLKVERNWLHRIGVSLLSIGCLGAAVIAPLEVLFISRGLSPLFGVTVSEAVAKPWILQPVFSGFSALSPTWLWIVIPALTALIALGAWALSGSRFLKVRRVPPWASGSLGVEGGHGYTSFGYANPLRKVLANLLLTRNELHRKEEETGGRTGREKSGPAGAQLGYTTDVVEIVGRYIYQPLIAGLTAASRVARKLQSGRLDAYMAYMLVAVLAVMAVVTAISAK
ncbi:MAG: proton-conducting transporter membrane subunit [Micrococcaceae bacterium]|nr:proton-conducting transporter membrane subunit [Micrococcaceae bacterium]